MLFFYIKHSKLFSIIGGPQKGCPSDRGVRGGLDPALLLDVKQCIKKLRWLVRVKDVFTKWVLGEKHNSIMCENSGGHAPCRHPWIRAVCKMQRASRRGVRLQACPWPGTNQSILL